LALVASLKKKKKKKISFLLLISQGTLILNSSFVLAMPVQNP